MKRVFWVNNSRHNKKSGAGFSTVGYWYIYSKNNKQICSLNNNNLMCGYCYSKVIDHIRYHGSRE